jgi:hypothetical protein
VALRPTLSDGLPFSGSTDDNWFYPLSISCSANEEQSFNVFIPEYDVFSLDMSEWLILTKGLTIIHHYGS